MVTITGARATKNGTVRKRGVVRATERRKPELIQRFVYTTSHGAPTPQAGQNMWKPHVVVERDRRCDTCLLGIEHAQIGLGEQLVPLVVELSLLERFIIADCEVQFVGINFIKQPGCVEIEEAEMNAGCDLAHAR